VSMKMWCGRRGRVRGNPLNRVTLGFATRGFLGAPLILVHDASLIDLRGEVGYNSAVFCVIALCAHLGGSIPPAHFLVSQRPRAGAAGTEWGNILLPEAAG